MAERVILTAFLRALGQIGDRRFRRVLLIGIGLTFALLVAASTGFLLFLQWAIGDEAVLPIIGPVTWLSDLLSWAGFGVMLVLSVFLMMPVASAITSMFLDEVAQAVEDRHYPGLPRVPGVPFFEALRDTLNFLGVMIGANIVAFILAALVFAVFPPGWALVFWGLNGFLLGREYFTLAAMRRIGRQRAHELRRRHSGTVWLAGTLMAIPLSIPLVNLLIPILGAATFTHIFHALNARG
ncbi:MAG: EI24 domain-containing protein [Jhaorihella sp.]